MLFYNTYVVLRQYINSTCVVLRQYKQHTCGALGDHQWNAEWANNDTRLEQQGDYHSVLLSQKFRGGRNHFRQRL